MDFMGHISRLPQALELEKVLARVFITTLAYEFAYNFCS